MNFLGFPIPNALYEQMLMVIESIQNANSKKQYAMDLFEIIEELSNEGLNFYFVESLKKAGLGKLKISLIENAINLNKKAILSIGKGIIKSMNDQQLLAIANILKEAITVKKT